MEREGNIITVIRHYYKFFRRHLKMQVGGGWAGGLPWLIEAGLPA
jgi:hypothetical protein